MAWLRWDAHHRRKDRDAKFLHDVESDRDSHNGLCALGSYRGLKPPTAIEKTSDEMRWDALLLVTMSALLLALGVATIVVRCWFADSDWPSIGRAADASSVSALDAGMLALGITMVVSVVVGAAGALWRNKPLLLLQGALLMVVLGGATFLAVRILQINIRAHNWLGEDGWDVSNVSTGERKLAERFDAVFCGAQLAYVCDHATLEQIVALGVDNVAQLAGNSTSGSSVSALCQSSSQTQNSSSWQEICTVCIQEQPSYATFSSISEWVEENCAYSAETMDWCGVASAGSGSGSLLSGSASDEGSSPYAQCRTQLLSQADDWTEALGVAWSCSGVLVLLLLAFVVLLLRSHANANALDLEEAMSLQATSITSTDREEYARNDKV